MTFNPHLRICSLTLERGQGTEKERNINQLPHVRPVTRDPIRNILAFGVTPQPTDPLSQGKFKKTLNDNNYMLVGLQCDIYPQKLHSKNILSTAYNIHSEIQTEICPQK